MEESQLHRCSDVSVIVVVRNGARFLAQALDSIFRQTCPPDQVIVVDGQSDDGTDCIARSWPDVLYVEQEMLGLARARNLGLQHAHGEFIAFLDHDDLWMPDKLCIQIGFMRGHPEIAYTTTCFEWFVDLEHKTTIDPQDHRLSTPQTAPTPSALVARRTAFAQNGLFDQELTIACDSEWFARARRRGIANKTIPHILLRKRLHDANLSAHAARYRSEWLRVLHALPKGEAMQP